MTETIEQTQAEKELSKIAQKFADQEAQFCKLEQNMITLRAFMEKHHAALAPHNWKAYGWDTEIKFDAYYNSAPEWSKHVAKAFGADGWTRHSDRFSCGSINWKKELDGCLLIIEGAEKMSPKLIVEVKL